MTDSKKNKFYVTTPIYYVTAKPHVGSLYSTLIADVLKRWHRLMGRKTFFLTGTDEHGQKIAQAAAKVQQEPKAFVDSFIEAYKDLWRAYELDYDYFMRTTSREHIQAVQQWLTDLLQKGDIYKSYYTGWYCTPCETFVTEGHEHDQAPLCPSCGRATSQISEESYFFRLSAYQERLLQFYQDNPDFIVPKERAHEVINFVQAGLKDLSISRTTISWGIPFPGDEHHVTYVWADALNNYITAVGYGNNARSQDFNYWWPADIQVLGKDIIRFHAVYWPAFLMASNLPLPKQLLVHGWIKVNQQKMSKSLGNVIDPEQLLQNYGAEQVRYYLMRQMAINQDTDFSTEDLEQRICADLANDLGNLLNRLTSLAERYELTALESHATWSEKVLELRESWWDTLNQYSEYMDECAFHLALAHLWKFIAQTNAFFHAQEPWKLAKENAALFHEVMSATCHALRAVAIVLWPVMPQKMEQLLHSLGISLSISEHHNYVEQLRIDPWNCSFTLHKIPTLFEKPIAKQEEEAEEPMQNNFIDITDFTKIELRVGTIESCQQVPKSSKLYQLSVNFGSYGIRTVLSGVRQHFSPEDLIGKQGVFVFNLAPRPMMGIESQGMMLFAPDQEGKNTVVTVSKPVPNGTKLV